MSDLLTQQVVEIAAEVLEISPADISSQSTLQQLMEIDSVALLEILVGIERKFGINIHEDEIKNMKRLEQLVDLVRRKTSEKSG